VADEEMPAGWRENVTADGATFSFRETSKLLAAWFSFLLWPLPVGAVYFVVMAIREQAWPAMLCLTPFLLAGAGAGYFVSAAIFNRMRIEIGLLQVQFFYGPIGSTHAQFALEEVDALMVHDESSLRGHTYHLCIAHRGSEPILMTGRLASAAQGNWVIARVRAARAGLAKVTSTRD
jgi:hypothetical protein